MSDWLPGFPGVWSGSTPVLSCAPLAAEEGMGSLIIGARFFYNYSFLDCFQLIAHFFVEKPSLFGPQAIMMTENSLLKVADGQTD